MDQVQNLKNEDLEKLFVLNYFRLRWREFYRIPETDERFLSMSDEEIVLDIKLMDMLKNPPKSFICEDFSINDESMVKYDNATVEERTIDTSNLKELDEILDNLN